MRIIDFRLRPPMSAFLDMVMYANIERTTRMAAGLGMELAPSVRTRSMEMMFSEMDESDVRFGVVPGRISNVLGTIEADEVAAIAAQYPERLFGYAPIDPTYRRKAAAAVDAALRMGTKGVVIEPGQLPDPMHLDDARIYPTYAYLEDLGVPVLVMGGGNVGPDITYSKPEHIDRVARDFPNLKIISGHANWPWVAEIIHVCYRRPNIWLSPDMYIFGGMPGALDYINAANGFMAERFLFATAYPLLPFKDALEAFLRFPLKESVVDRVLYGNAAELLGLKD